MDMCGFAGQVDDTRSSGLHAKGELVCVDASLKISGVATLS